MTTFLLVRHAAHDTVAGVLAGRAPGIRLGSTGRAQAQRLGERLRREAISELWSSPRERALETAQAIAAAGELPPPHVVEALDEIDFGVWAGRSFEDLEHEPGWRRWNEQRSLTRTPSGERMIDVQARVLAALDSFAAAHVGQTLALVTHADVIKALVMYHLALRVDEWWRLDIDPASITRLVADARGVRLAGLNERVA